MRWIATLLLLACTAASAPDETKVRRTLYAILAERNPKARAAKIREAVAAFGEEDLGAVAAAIQKGPLYPADARKARRVQGEKEDLVHVGQGTGGYRFALGDRAAVYAVHVPKSYRPGKPHVLLLDPGHGSWARQTQRQKVEGFGMFRRHADEAGGRDWLIVRTEIVERYGADTRNLPEEEGCRLFQEMFRDLATRFHFDPDRIYVSGYSQTGFWTWELGLNRADRFAGLLPMGAITWNVDRRPENLLNLPVYVLHGAKDTICDVTQPRRTSTTLARHGAPVHYREVPTGAHDYAVWGGQPGGLKWLSRKTRQRYPRRISKSLQTIQDGWCYWARIDALTKEGQGRATKNPTGGIDGELDGQTIRLHSEGVRRVTLCLSSEMVDLKKAVRVVWNGKTVHDAVVSPNLETLLKLVYEKTDWKQTFVAALPLKAP